MDVCIAIRLGRTDRTKVSNLSCPSLSFPILIRLFAFRMFLLELIDQRSRFFARDLRIVLDFVKFQAPLLSGTGHVFPLLNQIRCFTHAEVLWYRSFQHLEVSNLFFSG